ncbi:hypothetical protein LTS18_000248, partial [Coniosporium uncinatum]
MLLLNKIRGEVDTDYNLSFVRHRYKPVLRSIPSAAGHYLLEKAPIISWLPQYSYKWLLNDLIAGLTLGVMLIPQGLAYAKIATIPVEYGLMSSWLPAAIYAVMGTSKDLSTGPTSILGLLTANIISELVTEGYRPEVISAAVATMVGVYSLALGGLKLGWILDFISYPVLNGFISAAAIVIMLGQVDSLFGLDFDSGPANIIRSFFTQLGDTDPATFGVGFSGIILLQGLQWLGRKWGKKSKIIWFLSISRAAVALLLYTGISYGVNKNRIDNPIFAISEVKASGIVPPRFPDPNLISKVAGRSIAPLIAAALEHIAIAKAFGARNGYVIDTSQELVYLGTTNFFNSFFS